MGKKHEEKPGEPDCEPGSPSREMWIISDVFSPGHPLLPTAAAFPSSPVPRVVLPDELVIRLLLFISEERLDLFIELEFQLPMGTPHLTAISTARFTELLYLLEMSDIQPIHFFGLVFRE